MRPAIREGLEKQPRRLSEIAAGLEIKTAQTRASEGDSAGAPTVEAPTANEQETAPQPDEKSGGTANSDFLDGWRLNTSSIKVEREDGRTADLAAAQWRVMYAIDAARRKRGLGPKLSEVKGLADVSNAGNLIAGLKRKLAVIGLTLIPGRKGEPGYRVNAEE